MTPPLFSELAAVAFHTERVRARRLAATNRLGWEQALRATLEAVAGDAGLSPLIADRRASQALDAARRAQKIEARCAAQAAKKRGPAHPPGTWLGWFDGSARPNPGDIGIGALLAGPDGQHLEISRRAGYGNSGEAEYLALIALLEAALPLSPAALLIHGDSQVVIGDAGSPDDDGAAGLEQYRQRARTLMAQLPDVTLRWVPRHKNAQADRLSQRAGLTTLP